MSVLDSLIEIQGKEKDKAFALRLGIHRVSWQRIKRGRVPVSDKFLVRINRLFPELNIFLPAKATISGTTATNTRETQRSQKISHLKRLCDRFLKIVKMR